MAQQAFCLLRVGGLPRVRRDASGRGCFSQKLLGLEKLSDCTGRLPIRLPVEDVETDEHSGLER